MGGLDHLASVNIFRTMALDMKTGILIQADVVNKPVNINWSD